MFQYMMMLKKINKPLINALSDPESDGGAFADTFVEWVADGDETASMALYQEMVLAGEQQIKGMLMAYGSDELKRLALANPGKFDAFISQFVHAYDEPAADATLGGLGAAPEPVQ